MEKEIYLISAFYFVAAIVSLIVGTKMYFVSRKKKKSDTIRYFFYGFIFITVYLATRSLPGVMIEAPYASLAIISLFKPFLLIGGMFFCLIPLSLINSKITKRLYIIAISCIVVISTILNFVGLTEKSLGAIKSHLYFVSTNNFINYSSNIIDFFFIISLVFATGFYFYFAKKQRKNEIAFGRSIMIGMGCLFFLLAVVFNYLFLIYFSYDSIIDIFTEKDVQIMYDMSRFIVSETVASLSFMIGSVCFVASVGYKGEKLKK